MLRNGWILPAEKQSLCTLDFMQRVRSGEIFCPHVNLIKKPPVCVTPPPKEVLIEKIMDATEKRESRGEAIDKLQELLARLIGNKSADTPFLVQVLHLVNDEDEIFHRNYVYVRKQKVKPQIDLPLISNEDGFYSDLPVLSGKKGNNKQQLRLTKEQKAAMQL